jgi:hypothetical protein
MCDYVNFRVVLVRPRVACAVWGFCGLLAWCRFYFRVVRCLQRGSGALRAGRRKRDVPGRGRYGSANRGSGEYGTLTRESGCAADYLPRWTRHASSYRTPVRGGPGYNRAARAA